MCYQQWWSLWLPGEMPEGCTMEMFWAAYEPIQRDEEIAFELMWIEHLEDVVAHCKWKRDYYPENPEKQAYYQNWIDTFEGSIAEHKEYLDNQIQQTQL